MAGKGGVSTRALARSWAHSHEEDSGDELVFRPADFDFPPARGRNSLDLRKGGTARRSGPGPDDRTVSSSAGWRLDHDDELVVTSDAGEQRYKVHSVDEQKLILTRLT